MQWNLNFNPDQLKKDFRDEGISRSDKICPGCVLTHVPPQDCIHPAEDLKESWYDGSVIQSDLLCPHCRITAEETGELFYLSDDPDLTQKIKELEFILENCWE